MKTKFLEKDDVTLRPMEKDDAEFLRDMIAHPDVRDTIGRPPKPQNLEDQKEWIESSTKDDDREDFIIEYQEERAGSLSIDGLENQYRRGEFGLSVHPDHHNKGIGTVAVELILKYAFETMNMHRVTGGYLEHNPPSKRIMEKAGMQEEGRERDFKYVNSEWKDVIWMGILENEYHNQKKKN